MAYAPERYWYLTFRRIDFFRFVKKLRFIFLFFIFFGGLWQEGRGQTFDTVTLKEISDFIEKIQAYREGYQNYKISFREFNGSSLLFGELYYTKPDQMRITYRRGKTVVTEVFLGKEKLIVYFVNSAIVYEQENFNTYKSETPMRPGSLDYLLKNYNFNFKFKDPVPVFEGDDYLKFNLTSPPKQLAYNMILAPKDVTAGLDGLEIWLLAESSGDDYLPTQIIRSRIVSLTDEISDVYFSQIEVNQIFPADIYNFVIPAHVRIVKNHIPALEEVDLGAE